MLLCRSDAKPHHGMLECMKKTMHSSIFRKFRKHRERERERVLDDSTEIARLPWLLVTLIHDQSLDLLPAPFRFVQDSQYLKLKWITHKCYHVKVTPNPRHDMLECIKNGNALH